MQHFIKNISVLILLLTCSLQVTAQQVSNPSDNIPEIDNSTPATVTYPGLSNLTGITKFNYIRTWTPDEPVTTQQGATYHRQTIDYFDGLGRPLQTVMREGHADGYDIVQHHVYDAIGRESVQYLPFAIPLGVSTGKFQPSVLNRLQSFYPPGLGEHPYSITEYDNSPLNREIKQMGPGASWVGSDRGIGKYYGTNGPWSYYAQGQPPASLLPVKNAYPRWTIGMTAAAVPQYAGSYADNELYAITVTDEDGNSSTEFTDKQGRLVMKRCALTNKKSINTLPSDYTYTCYVYDDMDRLRAILPPLACKPTVTPASGYYQTGWSLNQDQFDGLCYRYFYDERNRQTEKKLPGKAVEYFIYDKRDRLVLYQDGNLRPLKKWQFTIHDALDRPFITGLYYSTQTKENLLTILTNATVYNIPSLFHYVKDYTLMPVYLTAITQAEILTLTYYDDYSDLPATGYAYNAAYYNTSLPSPFPAYLVSPVKSAHTKGLVTGTKVKIKDPDNPAGNNWLTTVNYYDDKGRLLQSHADNIKGGKDVSSNVYYFQGMLWKNILRHQNPAALDIPGSTQSMTLVRLENTFERNIGLNGGNDQVWQQTKKINDGIPYEFAYYDYDHLGRIVTKQFPAFVQLQTYNVHGWLKSIQTREANVTNPGSMKHFFSEELFYDKGFASKLYNGNITGITWTDFYTGTQPTKKRAYGYSYDRLNRLTHAEFRQQDGPPPLPMDWKKDNTDFTASNITYDLNGNLQSMNQQAPKPGGGTLQMDKLTYKYLPNSNQLRNVLDGIDGDYTGGMGLPDFKNPVDLTTEYTYDPNGNMITDENKLITTPITYSYLNKPEKIVTPEGSITYVYDVTGNRLQKKINNGTTTEIYDYIGNFVYKDNVLQYILTEEGRARPVAKENNLTGYVYDYFTKDHLGNVHSTVTADPIDQNYLAEHEIALANIEQLFFDNIPAVREDKPGSTNPDDNKAAELIAEDATKRIGTAIMLKVMPGDRFVLSADTWYDRYEKSDENVSLDGIVTSLLGALLGGQTYEGIPVSELPRNVQIVKGALENPGLADELSNVLNLNDNPDAPKAHLNYLFFDEQFNFIKNGSGSVQVPQGITDWTNITPASTGVEVVWVEPGFAIIYVSNQSIGTSVWFDDIHVEHYNSELLDEHHYYPFGLTISTNAGSNITPNPYKFGTKELETSFGLNWYDFIDRPYDMQRAQFTQLDKHAEQYVETSPYAYALNNPISFMDPDGKDPIHFSKLAYSGSWSDYLKTIPNAAISIGQGVVDATWNSADANIQSLQRGTWMQDMGNEISGVPGAVSQYVSNSVDYAVNTPITQQLKDAVSPQAVESMLAFTAVMAAGTAKVPEVNVGFPRGKTTTIYRSISEGEASSITSTNQLSFGTGMEVKQFWLDKSGLDNFNKTGFGNGFNLEMKVPKSLIGEGKAINTSVQVDMHLGRNGTINNLNSLNQVNKEIKYYKITPFVQN